MSTRGRNIERRWRMQARVLAVLISGTVVLVGAGIASAAPSSHGPSVPANFPKDKAALMQGQLDEAANRKVPKKPTVDEGRAMAAAGAGQVETFARTVGITEGMAQSPFPHSQFQVSNFYHGPAGGLWMLVYAGTALDASGATQGSLRVLSESDTGSITPIGAYDAPKPCTTLRITGYSGTILTLVTESGAKIAFDIAKLTYV